MLFKRREKRSLAHRVRSLLWPQAGWRRTGVYIWHRIMRMPGTPYSIAAGFAVGAAISFTPFIGLHFVLAALIAWIMRANIVASAVGTLVGNPWTFPFIWIWTYLSGCRMIGIACGQLPADLTASVLIHNFWLIFLPMLAGGIPTALVAWAVFYFSVRSAVVAYKRERLLRRIRKLKIMEKFSRHGKA